MTKQNKKYYYVLVFTNNGPKYVTSLEDHKYARWDATKAPLALSRDFAHDMAVGLMWNGTSAIVVESKWEIENHPYRYSSGYLKWVNQSENEEKKA